MCTAFVGAAPLLAGPRGRDQLPPPRLRGRGVLRPTAGRSSASRASSWSPSRCRRCRSAFWNDPDGARYRAAYFDDFPGVWRHGDWITFTERGACVITGRSDATLNRGGVRIGTGEFYAVVEGLPEVADSLVVHLEDDDGGHGELLLFVALAPTGVALDDALEARIARRAAHAAVAAPRARRDRGRARRSRARCRARSSRCRSSASSPATPPDAVASRGSLADPTALDAFVARAQMDEHRRRTDELRRAADLGGLVPRAAAQPGIPIARARIDPVEAAWVDRCRARCSVLVRQGDDRAIARGEGLTRAAATSR